MRTHNFKDKIELRKLKSEVAKLKNSVAIWNNPKHNVIGLGDFCDEFFLEKEVIKKFIEEEKISSFTKRGRIFFFEDILINNLKKNLK